MVTEVPSGRANFGVRQFVVSRCRSFYTAPCACCAGLPAPPPAELVRDGRRLHTGVLAIGLLQTNLWHTKVYRPQAMLQLDHVDGRQECRRTGVRERWARRKASLRLGIVDWALKFTFCVDVDLDASAGDGPGVNRCLQVCDPCAACGDKRREPCVLAQRRWPARRERCRAVQVELVEVAATLKDRMRAYWAPDLEHAHSAENEHGEDSSREAVLMAVARIPLSTLLARPNEPCQAIWQLFARPREPASMLSNEREPEAVGTVTLEVSWLPAAEAERSAW